MPCSKVETLNCCVILNLGAKSVGYDTKNYVFLFDIQAICSFTQSLILCLFPKTKKIIISVMPNKQSFIELISISRA